MNNTWNLLGHEIKAGEKLQTVLKPYDEDYEIPATFVNGMEEGKTLVVSGGIHSGEYPGVMACIEAANEINPKHLKGRIIFLHCVNTSGFFAKVDSIIPEDGFNLNRDFNSDKNGTIGQRISAFLEYNIMPEADFIMDLHSGSSMETMADCLFFNVVSKEEVCKACLELAKATDIKNLIASRATKGFSSYASVNYDIPSVLIERGYGNHTDREFYKGFIRDIYLVLEHFGFLDTKTEREVVEKTIWMNTDYIECEHQGLWYTDIKPGQIVKKGGLLGVVKDFFGNTIHEYRAKEDCRIMYNYYGLAVCKGNDLVACGRINDAVLAD